MMNLSLVRSMLLGTAGSLLAAGCVTRETVVYQPAPPPPAAGPTMVYQPATPLPPPQPGQEIVVGGPPPPLVETVAYAPGPGYAWVGGAWIWRGRWVWVHGYWSRPPHPGAVWVPHRYVNHSGVQVYIQGYWR